MAAKLKQFRSMPLVKAIAKTSADNINNFSGTLSTEQVKELKTALQELYDDEFFRKILKAAGSTHLFDNPREDSLSFASSYVWTAKDFLSFGGKAVKGNLSAELKKTLRKWCEATSSPDMPNWLAQELMAYPEIRPSTPMPLFRGLLFSRNHLRGMGVAADGGPRSPAPYIRALLVGETRVVHDYPRPTSWARDEDRAERFATKKASSSHYGAMTNWLAAARDGNKIDGEVGLILKTIAQPSDIIVDLRSVDIGYVQHGDEGEMILDKGPHESEIVAIYTPTLGRVTIEQFQEYMKNRETQ